MADKNPSSPSTVAQPPPTLNNTRKDRQHHALAAWGNYRNYYFHRAAAVPDARLALLPAALFRNQAVLDLGCNAGKLTIECGTQLGATRALGIDLDAVLIGRAEEEWARAAREGGDGVGSCAFVCDDFVRPGYWDGFASVHGTFDTVLLLSVTKWLHLHQGDGGLVRLFCDLFAVLPSGGALVVEPQEWRNYKRAVARNPRLRDVYGTLEMRPPFEKELKGVGFELELVIDREEGGFSRPLMVWKKPR